MLPNYIKLSNKRYFDFWSFIYLLTFSPLSQRWCTKKPTIVAAKEIRNFQDLQSKNFQRDVKLKEDEPEKNRFAAPQRLPTHQPTSITIEKVLI